MISDTHPTKSLSGIAGIAPARTRGSFFTSALATLKLFANPLKGHPAIFNSPDLSQYSFNQMFLEQKH